VLRRTVEAKVLEIGREIASLLWDSVAARRWEDKEKFATKHCSNKVVGSKNDSSGQMKILFHATFTRCSTMTRGGVDSLRVEYRKVIRGKSPAASVDTVFIESKYLNCNSWFLKSYPALGFA
jgi:hypothetical protein